VISGDLFSDSDEEKQQSSRTMKPHVWADLSALPFLYPVPDLANVPRIFLRLNPEKVA
jgi:hypothetical protein